MKTLKRETKALPEPERSSCWPWRGTCPGVRGPGRGHVSKYGQPLGADSSQPGNWNLGPVASGTEFCEQPCMLRREP